MNKSQTTVDVKVKSTADQLLFNKNRVNPQSYRLIFM